MFKSKKEQSSNIEEKNIVVNDNEYILPLVPIRGMSIGAEVNSALDFGRSKSILAIEYSVKGSNLICFADQIDSEQEEIKPENLRKICCIADIKEVIRLPQDTVRVNISGISRGIIKEYITLEPFFLVKAESLIYDDDSVTEEQETLSKMMREEYIALLVLTGRYDEFFEKQLQDMHPDKAVDYITANAPISHEEYYEILENLDTTARLKRTIEIIAKMKNITQLEIDMENKLVMSFSNEQKARYLREKKQIINKELNEDEDDELLDDYRNRLEALPLGDEYKKRLMKEMDRFEMTPPGSQEASVIQSYLDYVLDLPWNKTDGDDFDISKVSEILDNDHYGLKKVKERILEYLAVIRLTSSLKSPILCLVGPPGVGKTSVAKSIANATNRKFVRVSLGGMHDEAEIRGHRKTYVGAMPGRIIAGLRQAQSKNPVFLLDEIDKLSKDIKGDPSSALLEALDPEQNSTFTDNYIEIPFDLSNVMFVTTANVKSTIPDPLLDRMEIIELPGYMPNEKFEIAKRHLIGKQMKLNGITEDNLTIADDIIYEIIDKYTRESGVRQLERSIATLCRKAAKALVVDKIEHLNVTKENLSGYLGKKVHSFDIAKDENIIGVVNGLAWTSVGGDTLKIEAVTSVGSGKLELTGQLGDVMKESAKTAIGHIRSNARQYGIEDIVWDKIDIHIHVPEGAVPKDGPSAGITLTTALISTLSKKAVSQKIAMTGEITLTGRVLPIGGLREKLLAANRAQITQIIIPTENKEDLKDIPENILQQLTIHFAENMTDVYKIIFQDSKDEN